MKKTKRFMAAFMAAMMVGTMLTGCGSGAESGSAAKGTTAEATTAGAGAAAETVTETGDGTIDELTIGYTSTVDSIAPFGPYGDLMTQLRYYFWEYLAVPDENFELQPQIAKNWETNDNGFTYDVEIYDYVTDSEGNKITAEDVAFSYNTFKESGFSTDLAKMDSITVTGDYSLEIKLNVNTVGVWDAICYKTPILSKAAYEASSDQMSLKPVGTAHYVVESFEPSSSIVLVKRDDYWQKEELLSPYSHANIGKMIFKFISDASQCAIAMETGDIDLALGLPMTTVTQYVDNPDYAINVVSGEGVHLLMSGDSHSIVSTNQALRQAICYAIDNQGMVDACNSGYGVALKAFALPASGDYIEAWNNEDYYDYDVNKAKEKLAEAGFAENEVTLSLLVPGVGSWKRFAEVIQGYLMAAGINVEINAVEPALYSSSLRDPSTYDLVLNPAGGNFAVQLWSVRWAQSVGRPSAFNGVVDDKLQELFEGCSTPNNHTEENIKAFHDYLKDQAYGYSLFTMPTGFVVKSAINISDVIFSTASKQIYLAGCKFN